MTHIYQAKECAHEPYDKEGCRPQNGIQRHLCAVAADVDGHGRGVLGMHVLDRF